MNKMKCILFLAFLLIFAGCESKVDPANKDRVVEKVVFAAKELEHTKSLSPYSFDVYNNEVLKQYDDKSVVFSPISHHLTLAMMLNLPNGDNNTLFYGLTIQETNELCNKILNRLAYSEKDVEKSLYNCYIFNTKFNEPNTLAPILAKWYYADTYEEDFTDIEKVKTLFLNWINSKSKEIQLTELPIDISPGTLRLYSNVTNFHGKWSEPFNEKLTKKMDFTSLDKSVNKVDMMNKEADLLYFEGEGIKAVELPYGENKYSMTIVMTDDGDLSYEDWQLVQEGLMYELLNLYLPKFTIYTPEIKFEVPIESSRLMQVAKIEVDESGSKATAITIGVVDSALPEPSKPKDFVVDKTFHYIIREKETDVILFMGRYY